MNKQQVLRLWQISQSDPSGLFKEADSIRRSNFSNKVELCSIINAKSGNCPQNCKFCAQSSHYSAVAPEYPLVPIEKMIAGAREAAKVKAHGFGIVTSGDCVDPDKELSGICDAISRIKKEGFINPDASLGRLTKNSAQKLKKAGLVRYHHNLETSKEFFPEICTTHSYEDRISTIEIAKAAGFEVCCGGLFGIGETIQQRIDFAFALKDLDINSVPMNFLIPIAGTPLENIKPLTADEILLTIAIFRIIMPDKHIKVCGGRERNLGLRQAEIFKAGADGMMIGGYLTQGGNSPEDDLKMLKDLGLEPV